MGLLESILGGIFGKVHIYVTVGKRPALEILFKDYEIIIDIINPILAIEAGLEQMVRRKRFFESKRLKSLKKIGYKIKIKYKNFVYEL